MVKRRKQTDESTHQKALRLWPGVVLIVLQLLFRFVVPIVVPEVLSFAILGGLFAWLATIVWWAFFSRAPRFDRWGAVILMVVSLIVLELVIHESMRLLPFIAYVIPIQSLVFVIWAAASRPLSDRYRCAALVVTILLACGVWALIRTGGITHDFQSDFAWRWVKTSEEQFLAQSNYKQLPSNSRAVEIEASWPGFRGPDRDGIIHGVQIETDWSASPPVELWRRLIGPGWSSFAVSGDFLYTQEQHGDDEAVVCYSLTTGKPVWIHLDAARFFESNGGAGPRGTPFLNKGRVYTLGATGIMNALDASDGSVVWSRNAAADTDTKIPVWGFSGSPLVEEGTVFVAVAGSLIAYNYTNGDIQWVKSVAGDCYSSPQLLNIDGVEQILLQNEAGVISVSPADGTLLWEYAWQGQPIVQPILIADGDILISTDEGSGARRISVSRSSDEWIVEEHWTSTRIKPYFNDSVIHKGHVYGFDGPFLVCVNIENGEREWKGGRYGRGQIILLADQNLILVLSEKGELALVEAASNQFMELVRFSAIKGKTWNHPVLAGNVLLVRNAQEMAAFRLSLKDG